MIRAFGAHCHERTHAPQNPPPSACKPAILRRVERLKAGGQDADANGLRRLLAKDGTGTENQYGESSQKEGTRRSLAITHSGPPVHLVTAGGRSAVHDGQARP